MINEDANAKRGTKKLFMPTTGKHSLQEASNENMKYIYRLCIQKNLIKKGTYFQQKDIHKGTSRSPDDSNQLKETKKLWASPLSNTQGKNV